MHNAQIKKILPQPTPQNSRLNNKTTKLRLNFTAYANTKVCNGKLQTQYKISFN